MALPFKKAKPDKPEPNRGVGTAFHVDTLFRTASTASSDCAGVLPDNSVRPLRNGRRIASWRVNLDSVTLGDVTLLNVEGSVSQGSGIPLLGMSFLNRMEMRREGAFRWRKDTYAMKVETFVIARQSLERVIEAIGIL